MRMHPICIFRYNDLLKRTAALKEWCSAKEGEFTAKLGEVDGCELIKLEAMQTNLKVCPASLHPAPLHPCTPAPFSHTPAPLIQLEAMQTNLKVRLRLGLRLSSR